ncbi:hypothetical protein ACHAWX_000099, partial [Stephanocyclus meneghinianus]
MSTTGTTELPIPTLKAITKQAIIAPELKTGALMSISKLADAGYTTIFHPHEKGVTHGVDSFKLTLDSIPLLEGWRRSRSLWTAPFAESIGISPELNIKKANIVYKLPSTTKIVKFLHAELGFPTKSTMLAPARKGNLVMFPGLSPENVSRFFPESEETQKGHMRQAQQG